MCQSLELELLATTYKKEPISLSPDCVNVCGRELSQQRKSSLGACTYFGNEAVERYDMYHSRNLTSMSDSDSDGPGPEKKQKYEGIFGTDNVYYI